MLVRCEWCEKEQNVTPTRAKKYRFCSFPCRSEWRKKYWTGENSPFWQGGDRTKVCLHCETEFSIREGQPITTFRLQKFCCHECGVAGRDQAGQNNGRWKGGHSNRSNKQAKWARSVISRDMATCQHCGTTGVELHAHHLKPFKEFPELRWEVSNGVTLCHRCHWAVHAATDANGVNSGKLPPAERAEDNPEPSQNGNVLEGVTTRGRAYRRWEGTCAHCGTFISKRLSDVKGKGFVACSKSCASKHRFTHLRQRQ